MKNENEIIVGLDIGTTKIACFIGKRGQNDMVQLLGFGKTESVGVSRGAVVNIISTAESIKRAVRMASEQAGYDVTEMYVGIAGQHIKSVQKQGNIIIPDTHPHITNEDLERLIEEQRRLMLGPGEEVIHIFPQNFYVDDEPLDGINPVGVAGRLLKADFHIVTGNVRNINNIHQSVEQAGYRVKSMVLEPVASAYAVLDDTARAAGVALVDIGGGTTDIAIFHDGIIRHTSVLPLAGSSITEDIRRGCSIMKNQAESLKVKFGCCLPNEVNEDDIISIPGIHGMPAHEIGMKTLAGIIHARTEVILEQVAYELKESKFDKNLIAGVVLTGGGSRLKHLKNLAALITCTESRIGTPDEHIDPNTDKSILDEVKHPMYATGIGLVLYGLEDAELNMENETDTPKVEVKEETKPVANDDPFAQFFDTNKEEAPSQSEQTGTSNSVQKGETTKEKDHTVYTPKPEKEKKRKWGANFMEKLIERLSQDDVDE